MNAAPHWLGALRVYLGTTAFAHLIWEVAQLPLYMIWRTGTPREIAFAVFHCTAGDLIIATLSLVLALVCFGDPAWPRERFSSVVAATLVIGVGYTLQRMAEHHRPQDLGLFGVDAGAPHTRHRTDTVAAMARRAYDRLRGDLAPA